MTNIKLSTFTHSFSNDTFIIDDNFLVRKLSIAASGGTVTVQGTQGFGGVNSTAISIPNGTSLTIEVPEGTDTKTYFINDLTIVAGLGTTATLIAL